MKKGKVFQGLRLKSRLDSKIKKYRQVFLSEGEKEVIIIYDRSLTPSRMCCGVNQLPFEYQMYLRYQYDSMTGLPKLLRYGYDDKNVWLITEFLPLTGLIEYMKEDDYTSENGIEIFRAYVSLMKTFFKANPLLCQSSVPMCITPDNIFFSETKGSLSCHITGLDTMLFPMYTGFKPEYYYDTRYMAPEILCGEFGVKSTSYSFALSVLSAFKCCFPLPVPDLHYMISADEMVRLVLSFFDELESLNLPAQMYQDFCSFLDPDPEKRTLFIDELEAMCRYGDIEGKNTSLVCGEEDRMDIMNDMMPNPFEGCFTRTKGNGLFDVGGLKDAKMELQSIVGALRHKEYARSQNITVQNILLLGPPGTGKTYLAGKLSEELDLPFYLAHTSDLVGSFHGESARNIRSLFNEAEKSAPCLLILDEFDCVAQKRNVEMSPGAAEPCSELLSQINECNKKGIIVVATTNSINNVDPAILRSKRFDRKIYIGYPDEKEKEDILRCVLRGKPTSLKDEDYHSLACLMDGHFVGADIALAVDNVCHGLLVEYGNNVFLSFYNNWEEKNPDKQDYLHFIDTSNDFLSESSFYTWCMVTGNNEIKNRYVQYSAERDRSAKPIKITYDMMQKAIKTVSPSSTTQQEREYAQIYQDFLPEKERRRTRIGF